MRTKAILVSVLALLFTAGIIQAAEELHGSVGLTYQSKYIWRGFDIYGDRSAIQPEINLDLYGTGFGIDLTGHRANSDKYEDGERWDYNLYYQNLVFEGEDYQTNYRLDYIYYNFPDSSSHTTASTDLQEINSILSWPNILQVKGLVPSYVLVKLWPSNGNSPVAQASGYAHIFMLDYPLVVEGMLPDTPEQTINLHSELIYNDGVDPRSGSTGVDHDWSNFVLGASTDFDLGNSMTLTPGLYHQITMDDSVNGDKDETWATMKLKYTF